LKTRRTAAGFFFSSRRARSLAERKNAGARVQEKGDRLARMSGPSVDSTFFRAEP